MQFCCPGEDPVSAASTHCLLALCHAPDPTRGSPPLPWQSSLRGGLWTHHDRRV